MPALEQEAMLDMPCRDLGAEGIKSPDRNQHASSTRDGIGLF